MAGSLIRWRFEGRDLLLKNLEEQPDRIRSLVQLGRGLILFLQFEQKTREALTPPRRKFIPEFCTELAVCA